MYGITLALLCFGPVADALKLPDDVVVFNQRALAMPVKLTDDRQGKVKELRLFVSDDRGRSWKQAGAYEPASDKVTFEAPKDGLYWFAVQLVLKDGTRLPDEAKQLSADMKVLVDTSAKRQPVYKSYAELLRENEQLRKRVEELERKQSDRSPAVKPK